MLKNNREPLISAAIVVAIVTAALQVLIAFGIGLSADQIQAVTGFVTVIAPLAVAWWARKRVTPLADPRTKNGERLVTESANDFS